MPQTLVEIEYCNICNSKPQCLELASIIRERIPDAEVVCRSGRRGSFEVQINDTLVHSKLSSLAFPDYEQVVKNVQNAKEGRPVHTVAQQPITDCVVQ
ncbi:migration and invasion enhancer 1 [Anopheles ziemanni]|uniref:migration and invasion enhancer 1 n=1 Tax=Anopheles coustani TaxID=139045 RepID=UPI002659455C|nr:migration and invasion enhancer 1 [Anopheles coustani]XP_058176403.1 migration and invasion enhancer 1 [Anopheles ziemanni]